MSIALVPQLTWVANTCSDRKSWRRKRAYTRAATVSRAFTCRNSTSCDRKQIVFILCNKYILIDLLAFVKNIYVKLNKMRTINNKRHTYSDWFIRSLNQSKIK